jgi:DNA-binding transcriptional ArsR family regulator
MEDNFILDTPERMKAVSHPLRLGILKLLAEGEKTNEELASALGVASGKLYFHTKKLLDVGMIELATTRQKGSVIEKLYRPTFRSFYQPPGDGVSDPVLLATVVEGVRLYENTWREIGEPLAYGCNYILYHSEETQKELLQKMLALMDEFQEKAIAPTVPGARALSLTTLLHRLTKDEGRTL